MICVVGLGRNANKIKNTNEIVENEQYNRYKLEYTKNVDKITYLFTNSCRQIIICLLCH